jgi:hypothetical protein
MSDLVHEDAVYGGRRLEPRGSVDHVARRHSLAFRGTSSEGDQRLPGRDADPDFELPFFDECVANCEGRTHCSFWVVLVRSRCPEDRHHRVADELLDGPAAALELGPHAAVVRSENPPHVFGVHALDARREPDEIAEEAGDDLALFARRSLHFERRCTARAETSIVRVLPAAARTDLHGSKHRTASLAAEVVRDLRIQPATPEAASSIRVALAKTSCKFARSVVCLGAIDHAWSHRRWPRATARPPRLALVLGTTLFGSLCAIADEGPKWAALVVTVGLAVSLIPILLRVLPPLAKDAATNERDPDHAVTVLGLALYVAVVAVVLVLLDIS